MTKATETEDAFRQMYDSGMNRQPEGSKYPVLQNGTCIQSYVRIGLCDGVAGAENV